MVMVEALACGTPVVAFPHGAAREIVIDGKNGRLVDDEIEMADVLTDLDMDPAYCRESVGSRYGVDIVADGYVEVYRHAMK